MVKGFFDELGCQQTQVYDVGITEYGIARQPGGLRQMRRGRREDAAHLLDVRHDAGDPARRLGPAPFEGQIVAHEKFPKVLYGRGATNSKGPQMVQLNAFRAIKAVHGKLPVNLIVVAEGDEERMDIGLRKWVKDHPELLEGADAMIRFGSQSTSGTAASAAGPKAASTSN